MPKVLVTGLAWVWLSVLIILIDQVVKFIMLTHLIPFVPVTVLPFLNLYLAFNRGAAFSLFADASGWQWWFFTAIAIVISIAIVVWLSRLRASNRWPCVALSLVLGGALGNLIDRLSEGYVVDYFLLHIGQYAWPAFNVADAAISIGAVILLLQSYRLGRKQKK